MITKDKEKGLSERRKQVRELNAKFYTKHQIAQIMNCDVATVERYLRYWKHHDETKAKLNGKKLSLKERIKDLV